MQIKGVKLFKGDVIIIGLIVLFAVLIFVFTLPKSSTNNTLEIYLDGELINSIELSEDIQQTIEIDELVHNTIEIDGTQVRIIDSTCYDHVCENTGYISQAGEIIVCMPNKLLLKIVGTNTNSEFDAVVG